MKSNFFLLTKINLLASLDMRGKNKTKSVSLLTTIGIIFLILMAVGVFFSFLYGKLVVDGGYQYIYSTIYISAILTMLILSTTITSIKTTFAGKDYELLKSMPIKKTDIIGSKLFGLYLLELMYSTAFLLPNSIIGVIVTHDVMNFVVPFTLIFILPAIPITLGALVSILVSCLADRYKIANVISLVIYAAFFVAIMVFSFSQGRVSGSGESSMSSLINMIEGYMWINPSLYFVKQAFNVNMSYIFIFYGINFALLVGCFVILALVYDYVHSVMTSMRANYKYKRKNLTNKGEFKTLFISEIKKITTSKTLFVNVMLSGIMSIMFAIILGTTVMSVGKEKPEILDYVTKYGFLGSLAIMFGAGMSVPTGFMISLDAKYFWMTKTYPINYKRLMKAKMLTSLLFTMPTSIIACVIVACIVKPDAFSIIMMIVTTIMYILFVNALGLRLNLAFPKFNWKTEQEIVKSSASIVASTFIDMGAVMATATLMIGLAFVNPIASAVAGLVSVSVPAICFYMAIMKRCESIINHYEGF